MAFTSDETKTFNNALTAQKKDNHTALNLLIVALEKGEPQGTVLELAARARLNDVFLFPTQSAVVNIEQRHSDVEAALNKNLTVARRADTAKQVKKSIDLLGGQGYFQDKSSFWSDFFESSRKKENQEIQKVIDYIKSKTPLQITDTVNVQSLLEDTKSGLTVADVKGPLEKQKVTVLDTIDDKVYGAIKSAGVKPIELLLPTENWSTYQLQPLQTDTGATVTVGGLKEAQNYYDARGSKHQNAKQALLQIKSSLTGSLTDKKLQELLIAYHLKLVRESGVLDAPEMLKGIGVEENSSRLLCGETPKGSGSKARGSKTSGNRTRGTKKSGRSRQAPPNHQRSQSNGSQKTANENNDQAAEWKRRWTEVRRLLESKKVYKAHRLAQDLHKKQPRNAQTPMSKSVYSQVNTLFKESESICDTAAQHIISGEYVAARRLLAALAEKQCTDSPRAKKLWEECENGLRDNEAVVRGVGLGDFWVDLSDVAFNQKRHIFITATVYTTVVLFAAILSPLTQGAYGNVIGTITSNVVLGIILGVIPMLITCWLLSYKQNPAGMKFGSLKKGTRWLVLFLAGTFSVLNPGLEIFKWIFGCWLIYRYASLNNKVNRWKLALKWQESLIQYARNTLETGKPSLFYVQSREHQRREYYVLTLVPLEGGQPFEIVVESGELQPRDVVGIDDGGNMKLVLEKTDMEKVQKMTQKSLTS